MQSYPYTVVNAWLMKYYLFNNTSKAKYKIENIKLYQQKCYIECVLVYCVYYNITYCMCSAVLHIQNQI